MGVDAAWCWNGRLDNLARSKDRGEEGREKERVVAESSEEKSVAVCEASLGENTLVSGEEQD